MWMQLKTTVLYVIDCNNGDLASLLLVIIFTMCYHKEADYSHAISTYRVHICNTHSDHRSCDTGIRVTC